MQIDWPVLARQIALIIVPLVVVKLKIPDTIAAVISGPLVDLAATGIVVAGTALVGWVIFLGQRREQPAQQIAAVAALPSVEKVTVTSDRLAASVPSSKVVS